MKKIRLVENEHGRRLHIRSWFTDLDESDYRDLVNIFSKSPSPAPIEQPMKETKTKGDYKKEFYEYGNFLGIGINDLQRLMMIAKNAQQLNAGGEEWIDVRDRPLIVTEAGTSNWVATEDGMNDFIAAVPYNDKNKEGEHLWWIRHCVLEDGVGLCIVGDDDNESAGWTIEDVTHWQPLPIPPRQ